MKPITFKYANRNLQPSGKEYSANVESVIALPVWTDGEMCVSCWQMSLIDRLKALFVGRVWLAILSGESQPPVLVEITREYLKEKK